jgi:tRNA threonylcarbamoyladenosine biosynthesis protein TsaE
MEVISGSFKETLKIGRLIAKYLKPQDIICLSGELGSGKTVLTKGIAAGLGIEAFNVTSSSFVLIREHLKGRLPLYHFDLYRLKAAQDISTLGYEEYFYGNGISVIEWPERLGPLMPDEYLRVELTYQSKSKRGLKFRAVGARYKKLLHDLNENISD